MSNLNYNSESVMTILNNPDYTEEQKKQLFEKYKSDLKIARKKAIVDKLNDCAKKIPIITEEIYINFLRNYENDDLSKPFETIESEFLQFETQMQLRYEEYLKKKELEETNKEENIEEILPDNMIEEDQLKDEFDDTMFNDPEELSMDDVGSSLFEKEESNSVINEDPELLAKPIFDSNDNSKDVMPQELPEPLGEKGNASAIIISIIAMIIGVIAMYSIIKLG